MKAVIFYNSKAEITFFLFLIEINVLIILYLLFRISLFFIMLKNILDINDFEKETFLCS